MILTSEELAHIRQHAEAEYPRECCGVILTRGKSERLLIRCQNEQDTLHRRNPIKYPRSARTAYHMKETLHIHRKCDDEGYRVAVIYHSHTDGGAYFSPTDKGNALILGEPVYPDTTYVVVSVRNSLSLPPSISRWLPRWLLRWLVRGKSEDIMAVQWRSEDHDFMPIELRELAR